MLKVNTNFNFYSFYNAENVVSRRILTFGVTCELRTWNNEEKRKYAVI